MQPLVPLVFNNLPSLYPPSFRRNDFLYLYIMDLNTLLYIMCTFPDITEPATISLTPSSPAVMAGDSVTLTCSLALPSGVTGTPVFQWERPGVTPTPDDSISSGGVVSSILTLTSVSTSEAGLYSCTASLRGNISTNTIITVQSKQMSIDIKHPHIFSISCSANTIHQSRCTHSWD